MTRRKEFTTRTKLKAFERAGGRCEECARRVGLGGEPVEYDHIVTCEDGGGNDLDNCQVLCVHCHKVKTHKIEAPAKAEGRHHTAKRAGIKPKRRSTFATNRDGPFKALLDGTVVRRDA